MNKTSTSRVETATRPLVIGVGAPFRGDDEVGLKAVEILSKGLAGDGVDFSLHSDDPARIMQEWCERESVVVIDAVRSGAAGGSVKRFDIAETGFVPHSRTSSHGNALADAIELSRTLGRLPKSLVVIGVEPVTTDLGQPMSELCAAALPKVVEMVKEAVACTNRP